jgi:hypothetical protein
MKTTQQIRQNIRRFYLCQAYRRNSKSLCDREATWVRQFSTNGPTYFCDSHNPR